MKRHKQLKLHIPFVQAIHIYFWMVCIVYHTWNSDTNVSGDNRQEQLNGWISNDAVEQLRDCSSGLFGMHCSESVRLCL